MTSFEDKFFQNVEFSKEDIQRYFDNARRDLKIAKEDNFDEVRFSYSYQALLKTGICLIALFGNVRVKSINGHHIKLLEKLAAIMSDPDIFTIGNAMRMKRNADLYADSGSVTAKEAEEYFGFVEIVVGKASRILEEKLTP